MRDNTDNTDNRDKDRSGRTGSEPRKYGRSHSGNRESSERRDFPKRDTDKRGSQFDNSDRRGPRRDSSERKPYSDQRDNRRDNDQRGGYRRDSDDTRRGPVERRESGSNRGGFRRDSDSRRDSRPADSGDRRDSRRGQGESRGSGERKIIRKQGDRPQQSKGRFGDDNRKPDSRRPDSRRPDRPRKTERPIEPYVEKDWVRLNKFLADAGVCSRREADRLIEAGTVTINGEVVTTLGTRVLPTDKIQYGGSILKSEKLVYLLLNKPKGFITTVDDPQGRNTVMSLVGGACKERIYPVGRLDRNTTGLLLFTNDGELAKKLTHPKHNVRKIYQATLDKNLTKADMQRITEGFDLDDGHIIADEVAYVRPDESKKEIGIQLHSGRNRIVRRIFEHLGYEVTKLDRVVFGPLSKKDLPRGNYKFLSEKEINLIKNFT
ncbi:MAG: pseudouridine synthase [Bacteroidales bacterium]|nr:pseudouridine synthase [Bacteroidales bacterium]